MDKIEQRILAILDASADRIFAFGDDIWHHAELGYMETRTEPGYLPIVPVKDAGVVHEVFDLVDPEHGSSGAPSKGKSSPAPPTTATSPPSCR